MTNAVIDALRPLGVTYIDMPLTPMRVWDGDPGREGRLAVIPAEFDYVAPESLEEALGALRDGGEDAKLLAGGHSLVPLMKLRLAAPTLLVDLRKVPGLRGVQRDNGQLADRGHDPARRAAEQRRPRPGRAGGGTIADQQVRNRGTIGGSLAHGDPASDLPTVLRRLRGHGDRDRRRRDARGRRRPTCSRTTSRRPSAPARSSPRCACRPSTAGARRT